VVTFALNTGLLVDDVQNAVAFADGFGRTFRYARAAGDAIFIDFMVMVVTPTGKICCGYKLSYAMPCVK